jgi:hypothetical protein
MVFIIQALMSQSLVEDEDDPYTNEEVSGFNYGTILGLSNNNLNSILKGLAIANHSIVLLNYCNY